MRSRCFVAHIEIREYDAGIFRRKIFFYSIDLFFFINIVSYIVFELQTNKDASKAFPYVYVSDECERM